MKRKLLLTGIAALSLALVGCGKTLTCKTYDTITIGGKDYSYHIETKYYYNDSKDGEPNSYDRVAYYQFGSEEIANVAKAVLAFGLASNQEISQDGAVIKIISEGVSPSDVAKSVNEMKEYYESLEGECK